MAAVSRRQYLILQLKRKMIEILKSSSPEITTGTVGLKDQIPSTACTVSALSGTGIISKDTK